MRTQGARFVAMMLCGAGLAVGCDTTPTHESEKTLSAALQAVQYRDVDGVVNNHVESTDLSVYCTDGPMSRLWEKAGSVAEGGRCATIDEVSAEELDSAPDELRFLLQVVRFRCEGPNRTCADYGARAIADGAQASPLWAAPMKGWTVKKYLGDESRAVAYVDVELETGVVHRAIKLRRYGEGWRIETGLLDSQ